MAEKVLQTRIQLKYDTLANWTSSTVVLKKGEVAIATIPTGASNSGLTPPAVGVKIGDGTHAFKDLNWIQAIAGDVATWAKSANWDFIKEDYTAAIEAAISNINDAASGTTSVANRELITEITTVNGAITEIKTSKINTDDVWSLDGQTKLTTRLSGIDTSIANAVSNAAADATAKANAAKESAIAQATTLANTAESNANDHTDGEITALKNGLVGSGATYGTDTIGTVKAAAASAKSAADAASAKVDTSIAALKNSDAAVTDQFVTAAVQTNGVVTVSRQAVTAALGIADSYNKSSNKIATVATVTNAVSAAQTTLDGKITALDTKVGNIKDELLEDIGEMAGAMRFRGSVASDPTSSTQPTDNLGAFRAGDVLLNSTSTKEFIYNGTAWEELGSEGIYAIKTEVNSAIDGVKGRVSTLETDNSTNKKNISALQTKVTSLETNSATKTELSNAVDPLTGRVTTAETNISALKTATETTLPNQIAAVDKKISDLDVNDSGSGFVSAVTQKDGKIAVTKTAIKVANISDLVTTATSGADDTAFAQKKYVDDAKAAAISSANSTASANLADAIGGLDSSVTATSGSVLTSITQVDGKLTAKSEMAISNVGRTGNVNDLIQTTGDVLVFDCGTATTNV